MRYNRVMKAIKLTQKILKQIKPKEILYAEFANEGAMGACGTARIFTLEKGELKFYLVDDIFSNQENSKVYAEVSAYLDKLKDAEMLEYVYAGFGNYAYKAPFIRFARDDDNASFIYKAKTKTYKIPASCKGAYEHVVAIFAEREMPIETIEEYFENNKFVLPKCIVYFLEQYIFQIRRTDAGQGWIELTAMDYYKAVKHLQHLSGEDYILNENDVAESSSAIYKYRLNYIVNKLGWNKLDKIVAQMVKENETDLFARIGKELGEKVVDIYSKLETIKSDHSSLNTSDVDSIDKLFKRPVLVEFSKAAHAKIIKDIMERPGNSFNPDAQAVAYYLANYILNEDTLPYSDILPAVVHIAETIPNDDYNQTHTDELFWFCGDIIDRIWRYLEEDEKVQKKYRDIIYELYWPRVGGLWPVIHRDEFEFKRKSASKFFEDALGFVMSLNDIDERNIEVREFLKAHAAHVGYNAGPLGRRAFCYANKGLSSEQEFERILDVIEPQDYCRFLTYPSKMRDAELLMDELFRTDEKARITGYARMSTLESLVITPNTIGVGEYILNFINRHFEQFVDIVSHEVEAIKMEPLEALSDLFVAMSKGVSEESEFPPLKSIKEKLLKLGCDKERLDNAEKYARKHRRTILFQRSAVQKFF